MMKQPELGDLVYWYPDGQRSDKPFVAVVTGIGVGSSVCLNIIDPFSHNMHLRDGVRHINDKAALQEELRLSGSWDYTPQSKQLYALLRDLGGVTAGKNNEKAKL
jgi:hypothetical protein